MYRDLGNNVHGVGWNCGAGRGESGFPTLWLVSHDSTLIRKFTALENDSRVIPCVDVDLDTFLQQHTRDHIITTYLCKTQWIRKVFRIGTVRYNCPMSTHASQAFSIAHCTDSEDLPWIILAYVCSYLKLCYLHLTQLNSTSINGRRCKHLNVRI